jgi:hypothetical protein
MIGGHDVELPGIKLSFAARTIHRHWPQAVFQNSEDGLIYEKFLDIQFGNVKELLIYCDTEAFDAWERSCYADYDHTIHLIKTPTGLTAVVDNRDSAQTAAILADITAVLE